MAETLELKLVPFQGAELTAAKDAKGQIWAGVNWMCRGIGLSDGQTKAERLKIQGDEVLSKGGRNFVLPTGGGMQEALCLKLEYVPLWLAKISITPMMAKKHPETAERLVDYQLKAKDVLAAAFLPAGEVLDLGQLSPIMQALVKMEQRQKAQDCAMQDMMRRLAQLEQPVPLAPLAPPRVRNPEDPYWQPRCHGILYRASKKARKDFGLLETEACWRAANRTGTLLEPGAGMLDRVAADPALRNAYIAAVNELAERYGV